MKTITFLMPGISKKPVGGYKVVYEYANRLVRHGFNVNIVYPSIYHFRHKTLLQKLITIYRFIEYRFFRSHHQKWFCLENAVNEILVFSLCQKFIPKSDIYFATAIGTALYLKDYKFPKNKIFYLIQGFEDWDWIKPELVYESYGYGFRNIAISDWLALKIKNSGAHCSIIKNGFDFKYFKLYNPIEKRNQYAISMLYHYDKIKGCEYGIMALKYVKRIYPQLEAYLFGTVSRPKNLPDWIKYFQQPDQITHNKIYNTSSIYLAPSIQEGWGLTVGEAMICGNAIVCTDTLGFQEMVSNRKEGIIVPIKDWKALADSILELIKDIDLRIKMAYQANMTIQNFKWDNSYKKLEDLILKF